MDDHLKLKINDDKESSSLKLEKVEESNTTITSLSATAHSPSAADKEAKIEPHDDDVEDPIRYFECARCHLREKYDYFGTDPPFIKHYTLRENAYVIEDPFQPPKQKEFIVLGAHCIKCGIGVCKDTNCSFYFDGTYCMACAHQCMKTFPQVVQTKLNKIVVNN